MVQFGGVARCGLGTAAGEAETHWSSISSSRLPCIKECARTQGCWCCCVCVCGAAEKLQSSERYSNWKRDALKEQTMWSGPSQPVEAQARMVTKLVAMQREQAAVFHGQAEELHDWSERRMQLIMSLTARLVPEHQRNLLCLSLRSAHGEDLFCLSQRSLCRLVQWHRPGVCLQARRCGPARQPPGKLPMCPNSVHIFCTATACHAVAPRTRLITSSTADCGQFPLPS